MYPSLLDDEDWRALDNQRLENDALGHLTEPLGAGLPSMPAHNYGGGVSMPPLELDSGPDWSDALGAGVTGLAAVADLVGNHGHGTGQILASGNAYAAARADQRVKQQQAAMDYEEKRAALARQNQYNDYLYASLAQRGNTANTAHADRTRSQDQRDVDLARKQATENRQTENQDPSEFIAWAADRGYDLHGLQTMAQARAAMGPLTKQWDLEHAGEKAGAAESGRIAAQLDNAEALGDVAATKAGKVAAAELPYKTAGAEQGAAARVRGQQQGERDVGAGLRIPGLVPIDADTAAQSAGDDVTRRKIEDFGGNLSNARDAIAEMLAIRKQYGTELPGNAKTRFDMAKAAVSAAMSNIGATGTLSKDEREYYQSMIPNLSLGWTDALRPGGRDIKQEQLQGALTEFTQLGNGKLRAYGWGLDDGTSSSAPAVSGASSDLPTNFGVTGAPGVRNMPDFPGGARRAGNGLQRARGNAPMGGGTVNADGAVMMRTPSGNIGPVPPERIQDAIAAGWRPLQ